MSDVTPEDDNDQTQTDQETQDADTETAGGDAPRQGQQLPDDHPLVKSLEQWKAEAKDLRSRVKQYEDADKTEQQRLQDQLEELKPSAQEAARLRVAIRKGLTETQAKRLVGDSEDDLEADADDLLASFQPADEDGEPTRRPRERLKPGATGGSEPEEDPKQVADSIWNSGGL